MRENTKEDMAVMLTINIEVMTRSMKKITAVMLATVTNMRETTKRGLWMMLVLEAGNTKMRQKRGVAVKITGGVTGIDMMLEMIIMVINEGVKSGIPKGEVLEMIFEIVVENSELGS